MTRKQLNNNYEYIISVDNLLYAWQEFRNGKKNKKDVQLFERHMMTNIISLHHELRAGIYRHGEYRAFNISDPKPRCIHKATARDRVLHHALYRNLYPFFDTTFIADSYSCRKDKGTHKALNRFNKFGRQVSLNNTRTCWVLKCDIKKFFASVDHAILLDMLKQYITDRKLLKLLKTIIASHSTEAGKGLPLGNLTSQLLINIYMNEFDQFVKHQLKVKHYIRYADDFVFLHHDKQYLEQLLPQVDNFLQQELKLTLHPEKVFIKTLASGIDFLGWVYFPEHRILRTVTKRRMLKRLNRNTLFESTQSYLGLLKHGNTYKIIESISSLNSHTPV